MQRLYIHIYTCVYIFIYIYIYVYICITVCNGKVPSKGRLTSQRDPELA